MACFAALIFFKANESFSGDFFSIFLKKVKSNEKKVKYIHNDDDQGVHKYDSNDRDNNDDIKCGCSVSVQAFVRRTESCAYGKGRPGRTRTPLAVGLRMVSD